MPRPNTVHVCSACGHQEARWHGQCPGYGEWNTFVEEAVAPARAARAGAAKPRGARPERLRDVRTPEVARNETGIREFDRVLGGGLVPGSLVLLGGSPGIGKSTITASALGRLAAAGRSVLYVLGEESPVQV